LGVTVASGAFVAGNHAGLIYNEWPLMGGRFIPQDIKDPTLVPAWRNFFEHSTLVQFQHRCLAYTSFFSVSLLWHCGRRLLRRGALPVTARLPLNALFGVACAQVALGITTLLTIVPVSLGSAHQAGAITLLTTALWLHHSIRAPTATVAATAAPRSVKAGASVIAGLALLSAVPPTASTTSNHFTQPILPTTNKSRPNTAFAYPNPRRSTASQQ
jgi:heme A synthase